MCTVSLVKLIFMCCLSESIVLNLQCSNMFIPEALDAHLSIRERFEESLRVAAATLANSSLLDSSLDDSETVASDASEVPSLASGDDYGSTYDNSEPENYQGEMFVNEHLSLMMSRIIQILLSLFDSVMRSPLGDIVDNVIGGDSGSAELRRDQRTGLDATNMSGFVDMLLGLGLFICAVLIVIIGAVGLETLSRLEESSDRSPVRWIRDICGRIRVIGLRTFELLSCRHPRARTGVVESPAGDTTDSGAYEATPSDTDDIPLDSYTQVIFFFFVVFVNTFFLLWPCSLSS